MFRGIDADPAPIDELRTRVLARRSLPPPEMRRAIRRASRASLQDVASAFEPPVSRHSVMAWERGTRSPGPGNIEQYVAILRTLQAL